MSRIHVTSERVLNAQPETVYEVLADYRAKRPQILTPNFLDYTVEKGGRGAGTEVRYRLRSARRERPYHMRVDEPLKGWVLTEHDQNSSLVTTWTLSPQDDGRRTRVRVDSEWKSGMGVGGFFERTFAPFTLSRIYGRMLELLTSLIQPADTTRIVATSEDDQDVASSLRVVLIAAGAVAAVVTGVIVARRLRDK